MKNFHKTVFIGALLVFIDINIQAVDIVPDIFGYFMIAYAFSKRPVRYAKLGEICSILLAVAVIIPFFVPQSLSYSVSQEVFTIFMAVINVLNFACIFAVSQAIVQAERSVFPRLFIGTLLVIQLILVFISPMSIGTAEVVTVFVILILMLVLHIYFLIFIWGRKKLEEQMQEGASLEVGME